MELSTQNIMIILGALLAVSEVLALTPLKSNGLFQLVFNLLKRIKPSGTKTLALCLISVMLLGCGVIHPKPETAAQAVAIVKSDYTTALNAASSARDIGLLNQTQRANITKARNKIGELLDKADAALAIGKEIDAKNYANAAILLVNAITKEIKTE